MPLTVAQAIAAALRPIIQSPTPSAQEYTDALKVLNTMLQEWALTPAGNAAVVRENFTLTASTASYTIGPGATFSTVRPLKPQRAFTRSDNVDYPIHVYYSADAYAEQTQKTIEGRPSSLYFEQGATTCTLFFYPTPDAAYDFHLWSYKGFAYNSTTTFGYNAFTSTSQSLNLGPQYEPAIIANLRLQLYEEFGKEPSPVTVQKAQDTLRALKRLHAHPVSTVKTDPFGHANAYDIDNDTFGG